MKATKSCKKTTFFQRSLKTGHFEGGIALSAADVLHKDAMNELNVSLQHSIITWAAGECSHREIARKLDIHRETVARYLQLA
jgi:DNA-directed RNA polymerase specialized sigma24 family protein